MLREGRESAVEDGLGVVRMSVYRKVFWDI